MISYILIFSQFIIYATTTTTTTTTSPSLPDSCAVCLEEFAARSIVSTTTTPCDHVFHVDCIRQWIDDHYKTTCPMCRSTIVTTPAPKYDAELGILMGIGGVMGTIGSYFLFLLINLVRHHEVADVSGVFQRIALVLMILTFFAASVSSFKFGRALRGAIVEGLDPDIDNDFGWVMGAADIMGINFQE